MALRPLVFVALLLSCQGCFVIHTPSSKDTQKKSPFKQMNFQDLINRYMQRSGASSIEGVYTISGTVIKKGKNLVGTPREKTTDRKENYATVAILREGEDSKNYIELSLNKQDQTSYSIIGAFQQASSDNLLVYKHYGPKGKEDQSFTFTRDAGGELLEGIRVENNGDTEITYKLTYVKLKAR
jgi:hypothetical protein